MKKLLFPVIAAAGLMMVAPGAVAQASGAEGTGNQPTYGPAYGTAEYYGNSGWTPSGGPHYPHVVPVPRGFDSAAARREHERQREIAALREREAVLQREREREIAMQRDRDRHGSFRRDRDRDGWAGRSERDRDGDGIGNRRDRYPDDPSRY